MRPISANSTFSTSFMLRLDKMSHRAVPLVDTKCVTDVNDPCRDHLIDPEHLSVATFPHFFFHEHNFTHEGSHCYCKDVLTTSANS